MFRRIGIPIGKLGRVRTGLNKVDVAQIRDMLVYQPTDIDVFRRSGFIAYTLSVGERG